MTLAFASSVLGLQECPATRVCFLVFILGIDAFQDSVGWFGLVFVSSLMLQRLALNSLHSPP